MTLNSILRIDLPRRGRRERGQGRLAVFVIPIRRGVVERYRIVGDVNSEDTSVNMNPPAEGQGEVCRDNNRRAQVKMAIVLELG